MDRTERLESIKEQLERNRKWNTKTDNGYEPSVVGEYKHDDVEWLIEQTKKVHELSKEAKFWREIAESCERNN